MLTVNNFLNESKDFGSILVSSGYKKSTKEHYPKSDKQDKQVSVFEDNLKKAGYAREKVEGTSTKYSYNVDGVGLVVFDYRFGDKGFSAWWISNK